MIIRVFRPTIHPGKEGEFEESSATRRCHTPDEEHLLQETWIGHYEVLPAQ